MATAEDRSRSQQPLVELALVEEDPPAWPLLMERNFATRHELADPLRTARQVLRRAGHVEPGGGLRRSDPGGYLGRDPLDQDA